MSAEASCDDISSPTLSYFTGIFSAILSLITTGGNFLICLAVYKDPCKKLRTPFMHFLVSLAISDLLAGCVTMPMAAVMYINKARGAVRKTDTDVVTVSYLVSTTASLLNLIALCVDRDITVTSPTKYRQWMTFRRCIGASTIIWLLSVSIPMCGHYLTKYVTFLLIYRNAAVLLIAIVTLFTYFRISKTINSLNRCENTRTAERKVTRMYLSMTFMFLATYVPVIITVYILWLCPNCHCIFRHVMHDLQFIFSIVNSAINPFVVTIPLKPFRKSLRVIFGISSRSQEVEMSETRSDLTNDIK